MPNYFTGKKNLSTNGLLLPKIQSKTFLVHKEYYASKFQSQNPKF